MLTFSYFNDGNVLVADPITQDIEGNLYATWVDPAYTLHMSISRDAGATWSNPIVIAAPSDGSNLMTYHPVMVHHPKEVGRAGLVYYGSKDGGKTWHGYLAETGDISSPAPTFSTVMANPESEPLQHNLDGHWDQGYYNPFADCVEYTGAKYHPVTGDLMGAFAKKMCMDDFISSEKYNVSSCAPGWDFRGKQAESPWQGFLAFGHH